MWLRCKFYRHKTSSAGKGTLCTMEALQSTDPTPEQENQRKGRMNVPLLHIPLTNVVPDELHLMLIVTDVFKKFNKWGYGL